MPKPAASRSFWLAFALCAFLHTLPFLVTYRLPMTDLPQHAAQVTLWQHYDDSCYGLSRLYEPPWLTPYLGGYASARLFATWMPVNAALKLVLWLTVVTLPLACRLLLRRSGADEWLALLAFPLAFGYSFYWGFLNTIVALPLAVLFLALAFDHALAPTARRAGAIVLLSFILLLAHGLIWASCTVVALIMHAVSVRGPRRFLFTALPYGAPVPLLIVWLAGVSAHPRLQVPTAWGLSPFRLISFFNDLLAMQPDIAATAMSVVLVLVALLAGVRPSRDRRRWIPALFFGVAYLLLPVSIRGVSFINGRFAVLCALSCLLAVDMRPPLVNRRLARLLIVAAVAAWALVLTGRFAVFQRESRDFDAVADTLPANASICYLSYAPESGALPGFPYYHYAAWMQVRKGGLVNWSFANNFQSIIRYRPGVEIATTRNLYRNPRLFRWGTNDSRYDFFLVRAPVDPGRMIFAQATEPVVLDGHAGWWWVYRRAASRPVSHCPPFVPDDAASRRPVLSLPGQTGE
jgi:hypothetical protein